MNDIIQLKITLKNSKPTIWRRILVRKNSSFLALHYAIQGAMGWLGGHLHEFNLKGERIAEINEEYKDEWDDDVTDEAKIKLNARIKVVNEKFTYEYDFGDGWEHTILVEKFLPVDKNIAYPHCTAGKMNCPPEDCGGIYGFYEMLKIINDKKNPEREEMLEWMGEDYDATKFNIDEVNEYLKT